MEKKKIEQFVEDGLELELLDKLNSYVIQGFNTRAENLIKILVIVQEKSRIDWMQVNQALIKLIVKVLPEILNTAGTLLHFTQLIRESSEAPYIRISYLVRQFLIGIQDSDPMLVNAKITKEQLTLFRTKLLDLNVYFLEQGIKKKLDYNSITDLLYNCVEKLEAERKIILNETALESFRGYIITDPKAYLSTFIRPYYSGTSKAYIDHFRHVSEPFNAQIFKPKVFPFENFMENAREGNISADLVNDIVEFDKRIKEFDSAKGDPNVFLYSKEMESQAFRNFNGEINTDRFFKLNSSEHLGVRRECLPPAYKS